MLEFEQGSVYNVSIKKKEMVVIDRVAISAREMCEPIVEGFILSGGAIPQLSLANNTVTETMPSNIMAYNAILTTALSIQEQMFHAEVVSPQSVLISYPDSIKSGIQEIQLFLQTIEDNINRFLQFCTREENNTPPEEYSSNTGFAYISVKMEQTLSDIQDLKAEIEEAITILS